MTNFLRLCHNKFQVETIYIGRNSTKKYTITLYSIIIYTTISIKMKEFKETVHILSSS